ncbi:MAG: hypothetical protein NVSMB43_23180 [Pseudarthrobacter sp.]
MPIDGYFARAEFGCQLLLQLGAGGTVHTLYSQLCGWFPQGCARAPNECAVQQHDLKVLTVSFLPS